MLTHEFVNPWRDIKFALRGGSESFNYRSKWEEPPRIDILAKVWIKDDDKFEYRRFTDCSWIRDRDLDHKGGRWANVDDGWLAVAWMPVPMIPTS